MAKRDHWRLLTASALALACARDGYIIEGSPPDASLPDATIDVVDAPTEAAPEAGPEAPCPNGLTCMDRGFGVFACLDDGKLPDGAITGCQYADCPPNFRCRFTDDTQTETACYENCGNCPGTTTCEEVNLVGDLGCLEGGEIPTDAPRDCIVTTGCPGNATCYLLNEAGTESACVLNCSN